MSKTRRGLALAGAGAIMAAGLGEALAQGDEAAAVGRQVEALTQAMLAADRAKLEALSADALSYGHSAGRIETKAQFVAAIAEGRSSFRSISLSDQTVAVTGQNAIVRHIFSSELGGATPSSVRIGVLQVWTKQGADWKLYARQAYRL
ncbi:nuclear transport factor 2 family protein [Plastoroseomonas hellenica]|uniref:nuclear transport factor 2 family protein n=1 Tax=Plastoroseomonas hellenica TaxID=2687306 RepID=UPI001BAD6277|nr:nuclear transport factor 2 family protein [Plastoroseomonas hellenica]MBR0642570.1 nuclear transport factor 2 family protein [Plastoroseomonas hellenica]